MTTLTADDQGELLQIAHDAVAAEIVGAAVRAPLSRRPTLAERAGAFVSLYTDEDLRGCIGYVEARFPLYETVARAAASATHDRRFARLRPEELDGLAVEISVLAPAASIRPEEVEVGRHGLILACGGRHGLLLPQVPIEHGWDREAFLEHLCRKAGLAGGAWRLPDADLRAFTAHVFGDAGRRGAAR